MSNSVDPVVGVAQVLSVFIGAGTAAAIAPHAVVFIAGLAGGVLGLMSWRQCSTWEAARYVLAMGFLAWLFAGSAAELAGQFWAHIDDKRLISPAALAIGWVGHRWPNVGRWAGRLFKATAEAAIRSKP